MTISTPGNYILPHNAKWIIYWKEGISDRQKAWSLKEKLSTYRFKLGVHNDMPEYMRRRK